MSSISDDERREVDFILEERKRKGLIEYLVRWKGSGDNVKNETWEPVKNLTADYANAIQNFTKSLKAKKTKRSTSRSRNTSRSRSRSSSRNRKAASGKKEVKSRSRVQQQKVETEKIEVSEAENSRSTRSSATKGKTVITETKSVTNGGAELSQVDQKSESQENTSSSMKGRPELEVQRVHNENRPVHEDDHKPRSSIWKVADYAVIVLFILSLIAAAFLFLEKFINLEEFKKQAFPNLSVLQARLEGFQQSVVDAWLYLVEQIKGTGQAKVVKPGGGA